MTELRTRGPAGGSRAHWLPAQLSGFRTETWSARSLTFEVPGWTGHQAGQHIDVRLTAEDGYTAQRAYSISTPVTGEELSITVQQVNGGEVSPYLVQEMELGDQLEVRGPVGGWFVWPPSPPAALESPILLVGGGSGVVPLMAMIRQRADLGSHAPFRLVYSVRDPDQVIYADELDRRASDEGLIVDVIYTREGPVGPHRQPGRITASDLATPTSWPAGVAPRAYVCGPTGFVEHSIGLLLGLGFTNKTIRAERFGPSGS